VAAWLGSVIRILPVAQRPVGYSPLGERRIEGAWVRRLGQSGRDCWDAILTRDLRGLQESMNECTRCWEALLPATLRHPAIAVDLAGIRDWYAAEYGGAMYSGCGGGYLYVASDREVPGSFRARIRP
jgi:hypothetical protein